MQQQETAQTAQNIPPEHIEETTCCIVGAGPAGTILALLLARKGIPVMLLEEHQDFERDFRGDTIHPSVLEILDDIGLADRLLQLPHTEVATLPVQTAQGTFTLADFHRLKTRFGFIALIPQAQFLEFIAQEAKHSAAPARYSRSPGALHWTGDMACASEVGMVNRMPARGIRPPWFTRWPY